MGEPRISGIPESAFRVLLEISEKTEVGDRNRILELILRVLRVREDLKNEIIAELLKRRKYVVVLNRHVFSFPELGLEV